MSRFKFPEDGAGFLLVCTRQRQTQSQQSYEGGFHEEAILVLKHHNCPHIAQTRPDKEIVKKFTIDNFYKNCFLSTNGDAHNIC